MQLAVTRSRRQAGDTLVEVLIAIAIISLTLAGAYASANLSASDLQDVQEHTEALKLVQSQVEFLRASGGITGGTCFASDGTPTTNCTLNSDGTRNTSGNGPGFVLSVGTAGPCTAGIYTVAATWPSVHRVTDNVTVCYALDSF